MDSARSQSHPKDISDHEKTIPKAHSASISSDESNILRDESRFEGGGTGATEVAAILAPQQPGVEARTLRFKPKISVTNQREVLEGHRLMLIPPHS